MTKQIRISVAIAVSIIGFMVLYAVAIVVLNAISQANGGTCIVC